MAYKPIYTYWGGSAPTVSGSEAPSRQTLRVPNGEFPYLDKKPFGIECEVKMIVRVVGKGEDGTVIEFLSMEAEEPREEVSSEKVGKAGY